MSRTEITVSNNQHAGPLEFFVNGEIIKEPNPDLDQSLVNYLRDKLGLTGTKVACGVGGCGSCTVILSKYNASTKKFMHATINACVTPICKVQGCHILTVEGLAKPKTCHIIQDAIARGNGTQCGFCTPGIVMSMFSLTKSSQKPTTREIKTTLQGNLCRCTGYRPIIEAFQKCTFETCDKQSNTTDIEDLSDSVIPQLEIERKVVSKPLISFEDIEELLTNYHNQRVTSQPRLFGNSTVQWIRPASISDFIEEIRNFPNAVLTAGCTDLSLNEDDPKNPFVSLDSIPELKSIQPTESGVCFGSMVTISEMAEYLETYQKSMTSSASKTAKIFSATAKLMQYYGSTQIRNSATLGGSLITKNPSSDFQTIFHGFGLTAEVLSRSSGIKTVISGIPVSNDSVVLHINVPFTSLYEYAWAYKITKRKCNDGAILNIATLARLEDDSRTVNSISIAVGGKAVKRFHVIIIPEKLQSLTSTAFMEFFMTLLQKLETNWNTTSSYSVDYVKQLGKSLSLKFYKWLCKEVSGNNVANSFQDVALKATRLFSVRENDEPYDLVGKPQPHSSAYKHATGEAQYLDDIPRYATELSLALVLSSRTHAFIKSSTFHNALSIDGVVGIVTHKDLPTKEQNMFGVIVEDEEVFASEKVTHVGQIIAGIVATSPQIAQKAARLVEIEYEDIQPCILTIEDAIENNSFYDNFSLRLEKGNCAEICHNAEHIISDTISVGGQEHFYLEPQGCLAIPNGEDGEMVIIASTQYPAKVQLQVADRLGVPANRITVKVKRVGGGFGGKECRCLLAALPAAIAAQKFGKPVRLIFDRETDMLISGKRHPFEARYSVAFTAFGQILGLDCKLYCDGGCSLDASPASIERALINLDNAYFLPNVKLEGHICKTNLASNTVFRGTGAPQAVFIMENIIERVASYLKMDSSKVRQINMYREGDLTHYGQKIINSTMRLCWEECLRLSKFEEEKVLVDNFNRLNLWKKRGIAVTPAQYGVGFTALALNQSSALVHIYKDGSVSLNHGGVEIGQGLHSKMIQIASSELKIPATKIRILETATDKVANAPPTAASCSSDLNGMAVQDACQKLRQRLDVYFNEDPEATWEKVIEKAFADRVDLAATGFYKTPDIGWKDVLHGNPFNYFSSGVTCSVVEVDCLTGQFQILKTDIVMDVGYSLNPAIDIGQIEGAFLQGVGLYTMEELKYDSNGKLETTSPNSYKIPCIADTPLEFNVSLLADSPNPRAVYSSKAIGEPPLLLATSVFVAIKDAIESYRKSYGLSMSYKLNSPATAEKILLACSSKEMKPEHIRLKCSNC